MGPPGNDGPIDLDADLAWTGNHSWTSTRFDVATADDLQLRADRGVGLYAGHPPGVLSFGDVVINAFSGIALRSGPGAAFYTAPTSEIYLESEGDMSLNGMGGLMLQSRAVGNTSVVSGRVQVDAESSFRLLIGGIDNLLVIQSGAWQLAGDSGAKGHAIVSQGADEPPDWRDVCEGLASNNSIKTQSATANVVLVGASCTVPAGRILAGSTYVGVIHGVVTRGATATAVQLRVVWNIGVGINRQAGIAVPTAAGQYGFRCDCTFTQFGTGVIALCAANASIIIEGAASEFSSTNDDTTDVNDTTTATDFQVGTSMTAAVSGVVVDITNAYIFKVV